MGVILFLAVMSMLQLAVTDEDKVIDLQELLRNVSDSYRDFGSELKKEFQQMNENTKQSNENTKQSNENFKLLSEHLKTLNENFKQVNVQCNENFKKLIEKENEILDVLGKSTNSTWSIHADDCSDHYKAGARLNKIYRIRPLGMEKDIEVFCDMKTDGGGWTVFQRRGDFGYPQNYFYKTWDEYKKGFGDLKKEFWLGNDNIFALSQPRSSQLRVDLWDMQGEHRYAKYTNFGIQSESSNYKLYLGKYSGNTGDSFIQHANKPFSTRDRNNDRTQRNCAIEFQGAWWYNNCIYSNLNGLNLRKPDERYHRGITWWHWKGYAESLAFTEMKLRPANF